MNVLFVSKSGDSLSLAKRVEEEGHNCCFYILSKEAKEIGRGMVKKVGEGIRVSNEKGEVAVRNVRMLLEECDPDLVVFDMVGMGKVADYIRSLKYPVVGGSWWADNLELDRSYGYKVMKAVGIKVPPVKKFLSVEEAIRFVKEDKSGKRWVFKPSGNLSTTLTYVSKGKDDLVGVMETVEGEGEVCLQEFVEGVEVSCELWWNGLHPYLFNLTMEEKKFMEGGIGANTGCYSEDTEILTQSGWKPVGEVKIGEMVLSLDDEGKGVFVPVVETWKYDWDGKMVRFLSTRYDLLVTPDHHMIYRDDHRPYDFTVRHSRADSFFNKSTHRLLPQWFEWKGNDIATFVLPACSSMWVAGNGAVHRWDVPPLAIPMEVWCKFLGLYLSEGSLKKRGDNLIGANISQRKGENKKYIRNVLSHLPFAYCETVDGFEITSKQLAIYLQRFGKSYDRFIPRSVLDLSPKYLLYLIEALLVGDGCIRDTGQTVYYTASKQLAYDVQEVVYKIGLSATVKERRGSYEVYIQKEKVRKTGSCVGKNNVKWEYYKGQVYDVTVNSPTHALFVRRNGKCVWSGNCMGNVVMKVRSEARLVKEGVGRLVKLLGKVKYRGAVDLNSIVNDGGVWGLEWTPRFGYDAVQTLLEIYTGSVTQLLYAIGSGGKVEGEVGGDVGIGVRLTIPPYPNEGKSEVLPVIGINKFNEKHIWLSDAKVKKGKVVTAGVDGVVGCVTARGREVREARRRVYRTISNLVIPQLQYRRDIGERVEGDLRRLSSFL